MTEPRVLIVQPVAGRVHPSTEELVRTLGARPGWTLLRSFFLTRPALIVENAVLRQQLNVLKRSVPRAKLKERPDGPVVSRAVLGGLHHVYRRAG